MNKSDNKCQCGHFEKEHLWKEKKMTRLAFASIFFRTIQFERGVCKKCSCTEYLPYKLLRLKRKMEYAPREKITMDENRCTKCGRLLENHENVGHDFQN